MSDNATYSSRFAIEDDGSMYREVITRTLVDLTPSLEHAFQSTATFKTVNVMDFSWLDNFGMASLTTSAATPNTSWWSVRVKALNLTTVFALNDGVLTPNFSGEEAQMAIAWTPPHDMRLVLGVTALRLVRGGWTLGKHYLMAYDGTGSAWRLPLPNLYDHLELCHGQQYSPQPAAIEAVGVGLKAFNSSVWNSDLNGEFQKVRAPKLFRFKPLNTGFEQLAIDESHWTGLCEKVSNEIITSCFQPV